MSDLRKAFPDVDVIVLGKKAQGSIDLSAPPEEEAIEEVVEEVVEEEVETPTAATRKADIKDFLLSQGHDEADLDGLTKAELLELV